jgi:hypothetical protein
MHRLHHAATVLALILSLLAPAMTCALPNGQMTASEHACCKKMKGNCGSMRMPASHSCCQQSMRADHFDAVQPESTSVPTLVVVAVVQWRTSFELNTLTYETVAAPQHSPPISPPLTVSILRI